jgi:hypothetical protein
VDGRVVFNDMVRGYLNEMHDSRSKIPSKKISSGSVAHGDLIPALKG